MKSDDNLLLGVSCIRVAPYFGDSNLPTYEGEWGVASREYSGLLGFSEMDSRHLGGNHNHKHNYKHNQPKKEWSFSRKNAFKN
jgi:hypothetical protein